MVARVEVATVSLWGEAVGALAWDRNRQYASFEFVPSFLKKEMRISPYLLPSGDPGIIAYPNISRETYKGLPGFLADVLPDDFGNAVIDAWLARAGRDRGDFTPVERLCYTGVRGMGALEFHPAIARHEERGAAFEVSELVRLASLVLSSRESFETSWGEHDAQQQKALSDIISVGTSAGGQRPKAVLAIHPTTNRIVSGQIKAPEGYEYWLLKFDGVSGGGSGVVTDPCGYGKIEYAYYLMARELGIEIMESRLWHEGGRSHFMTRRFDRTAAGEKLHMLSLCGMAHFDYKQSGHYSYEQLFGVMRALRLSHASAAEMYRRMIFNVVGRNQDDHTKNFAFVMNRNGKWGLAPAYDLTYSYNPHGLWTARHQMTINGRQDEFTLDDLIRVGDSVSINRPRDIIQKTVEVFSRFPEYAAEAGVDDETIRKIGATHRLFRV